MLRVCLAGDSSCGWDHHGVEARIALKIPENIRANSQFVLSEPSSWVEFNSFIL